MYRVIGPTADHREQGWRGGLVGAEAVAKSTPDGYTLLASHDVVASAPPIASSNVDYLKTLVPVIQLSRAPLVLAVHPSLEVSTVAELIVLAKRRPGMSYATSGVGTQQHYIGEWFAQIAGIQLDRVPYRGAGSRERPCRRPCPDRFTGTDIDRSAS
jgi:tripartite-type tricarboxylate transporter receptor subunit TctC